MNTIINEKWLKEYSPIPLNYQMKEISNYVKLAEDLYVKPLLGDDLYNEILDQVNEDNLTDLNSTLLVEAIYPMEGYAVAYEALPIMWAHISEVGITKGKSENSDSIDLKDMTYVESHIKRQLDVRQRIAYGWLYGHRELFPSWKHDECECNSTNSGSTNSKLYGLPRERNEMM